MRSSRSGIPEGVRRLLRLPNSRRRAERELEDEVRFHLEMRAAELAERGMPDDEARAEAVRRFGDADDLRAYCQSLETAHMQRMHLRDLLEGWAHDLRLAARYLRRSPGFATMTALTLAIGIGATTALFTVVNGVLLRPLPYPEPDRIVQLWEVTERGSQIQVTDPNFADIKAANRSFTAMAQFQLGSMTSVTGAGDPVRALGSPVSAEFFDVLGVRPLLGRTFSPDESRENGAPAVILSHGFWQRHFEGNPGVLGTTVRFGSRTGMIVGVMPPSVELPADFWFPRELLWRATNRTAHNWRVMARMATGVSLDQARQDVSGITRQLKSEYGSDMTAHDAALVPLHEQMVGHAKPALFVLLGASAVLLLIACTNVVNLLVARMTARQGEIAIRVALGAARSRIFQQAVSESMLLSLAGAAGGLLLAHWGVKLVMALHPAAVPRSGNLHVDWTVAAFAIGLALLVAIALGATAAWRGTSGPLREALSQSQRTQSGAGSSAAIRRGLVVTQMAMTVVLLVGAGLLARSFYQLMALDPGFRTSGAVVMDLSVSAEDAAAERRRAQFYDQLLLRLSGLPGVDAAGAVSALPLRGAASSGTFLVLSRPDEVNSWDDFRAVSQIPERTGNADFSVASAGYFDAAGIPLIRGRFFTDSDLPDGQHVAVVSASLARTQWPNEEAVGKFIQFGNMDGDLRGLQIVGVVGDVRLDGLATPPRPLVYVFHRQRPVATQGMSAVIRTGNTAPTVAAARQIVRELRPEVPPRFMTIEEVVARSVADRRFNLALVGAFAGAALLLAALGIYGVVSYIVAQRERELTIRVALGARQGDVVRLVLRQGTVLALVGIGIGAGLSLGATRFIASMLHDVSTTDPAAFVGVAALLAAVALLASYVPARRAARLSAAEVLRGG